MRLGEDCEVMWWSQVVVCCEDVRCGCGAEVTERGWVVS